MKRNIYLSNVTLEDAIGQFIEKIDFAKGNSEVIKTIDALERVTYSPVFAGISSPFYNSSAMDGIVTLSEKTYGASEKNRITLEENKDYIVVDTGDPIPKEFDSVIMIEDLIKIDDDKFEIYKSAAPWQNIRPLGEDIVESQLIVASKHEIRPIDIGALLTGGVNEIPVYKQPKVGILPTGTEIVEPGTTLKTGDIIEFNSRIFSAQVKQWGGKAERYDIVEDDYEKIKKAVIKASEECDVVLINAGSSAGREDFTSSVIRELGEVFVHGVAIKPGKPVILGIVNNKPIVGIPGYPVSAYFIMEYLVKNIITEFSGKKNIKRKKVKAILARRVMSTLKYHEFVRMKLGYVNDKLVATPLNRGAGQTMSLVNADAVLNVPQNIEGYEERTIVEVELLKDEESIKNTLVCIGSHDPIIDIIGDFMHADDKNSFLSSAHVGSFGGIMALKNGETHISPIHLLDPETGEYNLAYIDKYLKDKNIALIKLVKRTQGIMIRKENKDKVSKIEDISHKNLKFVNRQRGSGTRVLFDYKLKELGLNPKSINGYEREEFTHLAVAAAIANGDVDCGLGIYSAAKIMKLDFIPVAEEYYDIAIPLEFIDLPVVQEFIKIIKNDKFKRKLDELGGYGYDEIGEIIYPKEVK
ncbi:molybdopterin biosynthesis protein [Clostridium sp. DL1XJH146]